MSRSGMSPYIICWGALAAWLAPGGAWLSWGEGSCCSSLRVALRVLPCLLGRSQAQSLAPPSVCCGGSGGCPGEARVVRFWGRRWVFPANLVLNTCSPPLYPIHPSSFLFPPIAPSGPSPSSSLTIFSIFSPSFHHFLLFSHGLLASRSPTHVLVSGHRTPSGTTCRCTPVSSACRTRARARAPGGC